MALRTLMRAQDTQRRTGLILLLTVLLAHLGSTAPAVAACLGDPPSASQQMPVTTSSHKALGLFQQGILEYENYHLNEALANWRNAAQLDPKFAMAYLWISFVTSNPREERTAEANAKRYASSKTNSEQLMIHWITGIQDNDYIAGISAMNDLLDQYPLDKHLSYAAGRWLLQRQEYERARKVIERALAVDPDYPPALNILGYSYARTGEFQKAFAAMEKYTKVLPNEPNPEDSYAEVFEIAGDFKQAMEHYQAALKIDPKFYPSQGGLADTYSLMGQQEAARNEFARAIEISPTVSDQADYRLRSALTFVREKKYNEADRAYMAAAATAHAAGLRLWEARAHRMAAMYQPDAGTAMTHLDQAEAALGYKSGMSKASLADELARILRVRVERYAENGDVAHAQATLARLERLASRGSNTVRQTFHAASGALLLAEKKYTSATIELEEDAFNPLSMKRLVIAYTMTGAKEKAQSVKQRLLGLNVATMEQALVVPSLRDEEHVKSRD